MKTYMDVGEPDFEQSQCIVVLHERCGQVAISDETMEQLAEMASVLKTQIIVLSHFPTDHHRLIVEQIAAMEYERARAAIGRPVTVSMGGETTGFLDGIRKAAEAFGQFNDGVEKLSIDVSKLMNELADEPLKAPIPKPYQQRKFYTMPGSRQDKYSRSKK